MLTPGFERASQDAHYAQFRVYTTPEDQRSGLYPFERRGLAFFPPPPARLLLHGAGAGRELFALLAMGYTVDAYEPVASFVNAASARSGRVRARASSSRVSRNGSFTRTTNRRAMTGSSPAGRFGRTCFNTT